MQSFWCSKRDLSSWGSGNATHSASTDGALPSILATWSGEKNVSKLGDLITTEATFDCWQCPKSTIRPTQLNQTMDYYTKLF